MIIIKPIVICGNPKFERLVMDCNFAAIAYMDKDINEQYREFKLEDIKVKSGCAEPQTGLKNIYNKKSISI